MMPQRRCIRIPVSIQRGETLDTSKHNYTITFPAGQLPPVNAFWSVTMYDGKSQLLIKNPINRYLINSPMVPAMKKNADGSLTLYIQKDSPGKAKEANWLPAPNDTVYLVMRLYWPKDTAAIDLAARRRHVEAARCDQGLINDREYSCARWMRCCSTTGR